MEVIEAIAKLISEHGIITVLSAIGLGGLIWKGKSIAAGGLQIIQAPETVRMLQEANIELKAQLELMQKQLEENNRVILKQAEEIAYLRARLESHEDLFAKRTARKTRRNHEAE